MHTKGWFCRKLFLHSGITGGALDLQSTGRGFESYSGQKLRNNLGQVVTPMCLCHKAVELGTGQKVGCYAAGKVTAGLAEINGTLLPGGWLTVTCGLTARTLGSAPGPTLGNEYGKPLPFLTFCLPNYMLLVWLCAEQMPRRRGTRGDAWCKLKCPTFVCNFINCHFLYVVWHKHCCKKLSYNTLNTQCLVSHTWYPEVSSTCDKQTSTTTSTVGVKWVVIIINKFRPPPALLMTPSTHPTEHHCGCGAPWRMNT